MDESSALSFLYVVSFFITACMVGGILIFVDYELDTINGNIKEEYLKTPYINSLEKMEVEFLVGNWVVSSYNSTRASLADMFKFENQRVVFIEFYENGTYKENWYSEQEGIGFWEVKEDKLFLYTDTTKKCIDNTLYMEGYCDEAGILQMKCYVGEVYDYEFMKVG